MPNASPKFLPPGRGERRAAIRRGLSVLLFALGMAWLFCAGCATPPALEYDGSHPLLAITRQGIRFGDEYVTPAQAVERLESRGIPKDATIHILLEDGYDDRRAPWVFQHNYLGRAGYRRTILVRPRRSEARTAGGDAPLRGANGHEGILQHGR